MFFLINSLYFPVLIFQCLISVIQTVFFVKNVLNLCVYNLDEQQLLSFFRMQLTTSSLIPVTLTYFNSQCLYSTSIPLTLVRRTLGHCPGNI